MVAFEKMWDDVDELINHKANLQNVRALEGFKGVFVACEGSESKFITRDDFVDFWCRMLYYNHVSMEAVKNEDKSNLQYVYEIVKALPYVKEESGVLSLVEE